MMINQEAQRRGKGRLSFLILSFILISMLLGCTLMTKGLLIQDLNQMYPAGTILSGQTGQPTDFEAMLQDLSQVQIVFIGESHTDASHHAVQLKTIQALFHRVPGLRVGMEMFDHSYQKVLDSWSDGNLDEKTFLEKTHWYANWRYDFNLYRDILLFIQNNRIPLFGLNLPFHLPAKIAIGGIESLNAEEKRHLPQKIDTSNADHRVYVESIFKSHRIPGRENFEHFYLAQCAWEDAMAERIASNLNGHPMVVLAGNGHIVKKFGIPERVFKRTGLSFKTIYPVAVTSRAELSFADYLWITP